MQLATSAAGLWIFLAAGAISLFTMIAIANWSAERRKEREAYYRYEMIKRIAEAGPGGQAALEAFRHEENAGQWRERRRLLVGGPVTMGAGAGLMLFFAGIAREPVWLIGAIPFLVGLAMLLCGLAFRPRRQETSADSGRAA